MALKKNNAPTFEDMQDDDVAVMDAPASDAQDSTPEPEPQTKATAPAPTPAPSKPRGQVATQTSKGFHAALTGLENQLSLDHVKALGVGTLPKLVADRAGFELGEGKDKREYGDWLDFVIYSYNRRWLVTAGVDGDEGKELLRTSYDGESLEDEAITAKEYLGHLKDEGFNKAYIRMYVDIWGFVINSKEGGEVPDDQREMVQLQLSPSSVKQFTGYQVQAGVKASITGKEATNVVRATIDRREYNGNKYAAIKFS